MKPYAWHVNADLNQQTRYVALYLAEQCKALQVAADVPAATPDMHIDGNTLDALARAVGALREKVGLPPVQFHGWANYEGMLRAIVRAAGEAAAVAPQLTEEEAEEAVVEVAEETAPETVVHVVKKRGTWYYLSDGTKHQGQQVVDAYIAALGSS